MTFIGLTWDHPRGYDALAEAARRINAHRAEPLIHWNRQPLEGFDGAPIGELAKANDLIVMDHPHIGEAVALDCLIPLDDLFPEERIAKWKQASVGASAESYEWQGRTWALPLDVATQVMARRPDRLALPPGGWDEVIDLSSRVPVALSLSGAHALITLMSMVAGEGGTVGGEDFVADETALAALDVMHRLYRRRPKGSEALNPIHLLETMTRSEDIALVPLVFGYVTYAAPDYRPHRLAFSDTFRKPCGKGGVLGGTGLAFSRRCMPTPDLLAHIASLLDRVTQVALFPAFGGQPSARAAWMDDAVNAAWGEFYRNTLATAETALLRPRFDGYIPFQKASAALIRRALDQGEQPEATLAGLRRLWRTARNGANDLHIDERT